MASLISNPFILWVIFADGLFLSMILISNFLFLVYFYVKKNTSDMQEIRKVLFLNNNSFIESLKRFHLCFFILIPNLILINNNLHVIVKLLLGTFLMFMGSLFPVFYAIFLCHSIMAFFSFIFGYSYEKSSWFSQMFNSFYFKGNSPPEIKFILEFFFGNMYTAGKFALIGAAGGGLYRFIKQDELSNSYAIAHMRVCSNPHKTKSFEEFDMRVKAERQSVLDNETLINTIEHKARFFVFGKSESTSLVEVILSNLP
jgi:hypothetical protein